MATPAPEPPPDIVDVVAKLLQGNNITMALDPVTAGFNFATAALLLIGKIIDTVPIEQHAENWKRVSDLIDKLQPPR